MKGFVLAGTNSGCGKTTITIGLMALLKSKGYKIAAFKSGPDYIDPLFHEYATGSASYNLDSFMLDDDTLKNCFGTHSSGKDVAIVEGVMGLFDGKGKEAEGSTAQIAKKLDLPVILVINCKGLYQSVAAITAGFCDYDPGLSVKGVILNHVSSATQFSFLKQIIEEKTGVTCIGYIPTNKEIGLESRHLGLVQAEEVSDLSLKIASLTAVMEETINVESLLKVSKEYLPQSYYKQEQKDVFLSLKGVKLGVAYDKAFRFYYKDNLQLLEQCGAKIIYFSPLKDKVIPEECNALYLGGGYPEVFAKELSDNKMLLKDIEVKSENGMPIYAECGGLMYLCNSISTLDNQSYSMANIFNCSAKMTQRLKRFGYAKLQYNGSETKVHEFHRSELLEPDNKNYKLVYSLYKEDIDKKWQCGLSRNNTVAGYAHVHFLSNKDFTNKLFELWRKAII